MSHGPDLPLPPARSIQGWWRELASFCPKRLWYGRLLFHHLDALVETDRPLALDPLARALLRAIAGGGTLSPAFDRQVQARLLNGLSAHGLLAAEGPAYRVTPTGDSALAAGSFSQVVRRRQSFWFVDNAACARPPHFLLPQRALDVAEPPDGWTFPVEALSTTVGQPPKWKERHRFPADVRAVVNVAAPGDWRAVVVDHAEQFIGIATETAEGGLTAFSVRPDMWKLEREPPTFTLAAAWEEVLPDLAVEPAPEAWRRAWLAWCQSRGVSLADAEACQMERESHRVLVRAPKKLADRLRTARGEPLKNEAWLLAGDGRWRSAAPLEVTE